LDNLSKPSCRFVFGLPPLSRPDLGTKPEEELRRLHPDRFSRDEMTRLMGGDEENDGKSRCQTTEHHITLPTTRQ